MKKISKLILLGVVTLMALPASAQQRRISGTVSDDIDVLPQATVVEKDKNNRIVSQTITDMNGNFTMNIKDPNNTLIISYVGFKPFQSKIGAKSVYKVVLQDNSRTIPELQVTAKEKAPTTGLEIPAREYAGAVQKFSMDDMEGLAFESVDQALQGQIAGLDIVPNSGNLGSGTTMRLRGTTTINGDAQPLIVVNDHIFELPDDLKDTYINFETMDNEEQFSTLLNVNPEDIESITVLKDAASAAKWGSRGSNGVIEIKLRRGRKGPTSVFFNYKFNGTWQPDGYKMLNGDGYTMMLKEAYYNPLQVPTSLLELDYNQEYPYVYNHFSHNTDWVDAVRQFGKENKYYVTLSGGGEKALFRISAGYDKSTGSIIGQKLDRFTTSSALDYWVSDRIKFQSNINMTFTTNNKHYVEGGGSSDILGRAYKAMPNMSIWEYDAQGIKTGNYFNMLPLAANYASGSISRRSNNGMYTSYDLADMFWNGNPVARALNARNKEKQYNLTPQFSIEYKFLGTDNDHHQFNYKGDVQLNIYNTSRDMYCPSELKPMPWVWGGDNTTDDHSNERNYVSNFEYKSMEFTTRHELLYYSAFKNKDHSLSALARFEMYTGTSSSQNLGLWNVPDQITDPTVVALLRSASASENEWRSHSFFEQVHYSYKGKYSLDANIRTDGNTAFGKGHKYGHFPSIGGRWNIIDEHFMDWSRGVLSMLSFRPTWGITGNTGTGSYNQYNKYASHGHYNGHSVIIPESLALTELRWEKTQQWNLGFDLGFVDIINFNFEVYNKKTTDLLMYGLTIPSANGFSSLAKANAGTMRNKGWELNGSTNRILKIGKFSMKVRGNIAQNFNEVEEMNPLLLESLNGSEAYQPSNLDYNRRVQIGNALGSIYGLRYKGVYRYDYDHNGYTAASINSYGYAEVDNSGYGPDRNGKPDHDYPINTAAAALRRGDKNATCPIAYDADGNMLTDAKGIPLPMYYCYNESYRYQFQGGDAIYEDINHDGQIDRYDMVYLGNSNPKCSGGFGFTFYYGRFSINTGFNFRMGNKIVNMARMTYESMRNNDNQSFATTWRWRKNGDGNDGPVIPRALSSKLGFRSYNSLPSDRYVENGNYLRFQYLQVNYDFNPAKLKKFGVKTLKLFASVNNIWVWTKYTGVDPDVSPGGFSVCMDNSRTPRSKSFTCSLNLGF
ncbi:MAG: SusC/RagA family TonB-linked outer membrane protein [Bacteroidaceae bacterium]|nr:SusC/RagA family TonB-linked outer membrane protein [Bacteroidaceae bacterium]